MPRIALSLAGTGSLGAYTAGATTEILLALERNRGEPCTVEVLTGTSSGALCAALAARALVRNPNLLPWLERLWVDALDVGTLLGSGPRGRGGLLDAGPLEELAAALVAGDPASDDRPSPALGDRLRVAIALSGSAGPAGAFRAAVAETAVRPEERPGADSVEVELDAATAAHDPAWDRLRAAALASASFPLLLPPRTLGGVPGIRAAAAGGPTEPVPGRYMDGGILGPGALELAGRLCRRFPERPEPWRHLVVDPSARRSPGGAPGTGTGAPDLPRELEAERVEGRGGTDGDPGPGAGAATAGFRGAGAAGPAAGLSSLPEVAAFLARAVPRAAGARDRRQAEDASARLEILEALVERLPEIGGRLTDPQDFAVGRRIGELAERIAESEVAGSAPPGSADPVVEHLDAHLGRILEDPRYRPVLARVETRAGRTRLAKLIFILESAGGLRDRHRLRLHLVAPPPAEAPAGDFLGGFGGLLHRDWREADFRAGRRDARRVVEEELGDIVSYETDRPEAYEVADRTPSYDALPPEARLRVEALARREADRVLRAVRPGGLASLLGWAWRPALRRWAAAEIVDAIRRAG